MGNKLFPWNSQPSPPLAEHQTVLFTMHSPTAVRQNYQAKTSRLQFPSPHFSGPRCQVHHSGQCQPHHQTPQTGQLRGNCRKLPHFLVPPERERSPARRAEEMRRKASRRADPGTVKCPKVGARRSAVLGLSCPGCAGPAASPARQIDT